MYDVIGEDGVEVSVIEEGDVQQVPGVMSLPQAVDAGFSSSELLAGMAVENGIYPQHGDVPTVMTALDRKVDGVDETVGSIQRRALEHSRINA